MAELETITILRVDTGEAVRSVGDLKDNIKILKDALNGLEIGTQEYQDTLSELKVNQNALRDAMFATSASMEDVAKSATGASESYNSLVNRMKALKEEFRSTGDEARRMELGVQIKAVNDQLKEMDAMQGNFQRNVGNYAGSIKEALKDIPSFAGPVKKSIDNIDKSMGLLSKNPLLGIITLLYPLIAKITDGLKDNKTAIDAINKAMKALEPVFNIVTKTVEKLADWLSKAVDWFVKLLDGSRDTFQNIISGAVGVGNAILQYLLTPIRTAIEAFKGLGNIVKDVFTGQWKQIREDAVTAYEGIKDAFKKGFDFKENFAQGKAIGEQWISGLMSTKGQAKSAGKEIGTAIGEGMVDGLDSMEKEIEGEFQKLLDAQRKADEEANKIAQSRAKVRLDQISKDEQQAIRISKAAIDDEAARQEAIYNIQQDANQRRLDALRQFREEALGRGDLEAMLEYEQEIADLEVEIELTKFERMEEIRKENEENQKHSWQEILGTAQAVISSMSAIFGNLAEMYEADAENNQKAVKRAKALRIAEATVNTIGGAVGAFASAAANITAPYGVIIGAIQAATVLAAGFANIANMRSTKVDMNSSGSSSSASVSAPTVTVAPQQTTVVQSASDEQKLNSMLADQRVYILDSDIEAKGNERKVQVQESSF